MAQADLMDKVVALAKRRGFIFQSSEIYGGLNGAWDYGPMGAELKRNVKNAWWQSIVHFRDDIVGLDAAILMHPRVWEASGHAQNFSDPMLVCKKCNQISRVDFLIPQIRCSNPKCDCPPANIQWSSLQVKADFINKFGQAYADEILPQLQNEPCPKCRSKHNLIFICPSCKKADFPKDFTPIRQFNLMFKTFIGPVEDTSSQTYLRPETAQGIFVNFANVIDSTHRKLPFGIAQIGKSFRNEVTTKNFTFRSREFEQMEIEYFCRPEQALVKYEEWIQARFSWYTDLGIKKENLKLRVHDKDELAHYAAGCTDVEYNFPFGWSELEGIANRGDYDLKQHSKFSGKDLQYQDPVTLEKFFPHVIEPSGGCDRGTLAFLVDAYHEETVNDTLRVVMKFHPKLAPIKVAVLPLLKKNEGIVALAKKIKSELQKEMVCVYDDSAAIGKLYRRQDEVGTVFCVTVDVQSLEDKQVTVRFRDTMQQERIPVERLLGYLKEKLN